MNIGDLDGDGRPDVFCVGGPVANGLYLQVGEPGEMRFERLPDGMVDGGDAWGTGASLVDIDGDGDLDIHVCNYDSPNQLFINESTPGTPAFAEEAALHGLDIRDASIVSSFADVDNDGDLDAYIACNRYVPPNGLPTEAPGRFDPETESVVMFPQYGGTSGPGGRPRELRGQLRSRRLPDDQHRPGSRQATPSWTRPSIGDRRGRACPRGHLDRRRIATASSTCTSPTTSRIRPSTGTSARARTAWSVSST